ncbi:MAG: DUF2800 domain-containing protein [Patescibacteria group bacterium]|nr:DUF2800 domain-containing protein [Patescibacteria group bacterium]
MFSPSSAHRWMECPGSMSYPENTAQDESSPFAEEGTAAHILAARALTYGKPAEFFLGEQIQARPTSPIFTVDEEMASNVQVYLDEIDRRSLGVERYIERQVDLSDAIGIPGQFGTADCIILRPDDGILEVHDLKYGKGEKVSAEWNHQLLLYALGALREFDLIYEFRGVRVAIHQPRINNFVVFPSDDRPALDIMQLWGWLREYETKIKLAQQRYIEPPAAADAQRIPAEKTCRWCRAKAKCPELAQYVASHVGRDFEILPADAPVVPAGLDKLAAAYAAVPLIEDWCRSVSAEVLRVVQAGGEIIGTDGEPMKIVEGRPGNRAWTDELQAEAALLGQLGPVAYQPQKIITASAAAKKLDKAKTKALWQDQFEPLIKRAPGSPTLALGSDPRPPYSGKATSDEFDNEDET